MQTILLNLKIKNLNFHWLLRLPFLRFIFSFFPGFDIGFDLTETFNLYANYGKTYRIPTYTDLYYSDRNTIGNSELEPEHAITNEIGFKYNFNNVKIYSSILLGNLII